MKFEVVYTVEGPGGRVLVPNVSNPVEAESLKDVLERLVSSELFGKPLNLDLRIICISVKELP